MAMKSKRTILEIELLRGFAIIGVIILHTCKFLFEIRSTNLLKITITTTLIFSNFAVPLFLFISGFVLCQKYYNNYSIKEFYQKRTRVILPPYLIFSILYIIFYFYFFGEPLTIKDGTFKIISSSSALQMWFFILILQLYLLYPLIIYAYKYLEKRHFTTQFILLILVIQLIYNIVVYLFQTNLTSFLNTIGINSFIIDIVSIYLPLRVFVSHIFYFILGIYVYRNYNSIINKLFKLKKTLLICIIIELCICILFFWIINNLSTFYYTMPIILKPIICVMTFGLLLKLSKEVIQSKNLINKIIQNIGKYSYGIFLIHVFFLELIVIGLDRIEIGPGKWVFYPLLLIFTFIASYLSVRIINLFPGSNWIIGS